MSEENYNPKRLALEIEFHGRIETVLKRHTALICWNKPGMSPTKDREDNGTCCFIETEKLRCIATCAHVWKGYLKDAAEKGAGNMWLSLTASDDMFAPAFPYQISKPISISEDTNLDLATFTFDGINSLESWRFHRMRHTTRQKISKGDGVFFLGYSGDVVRKAGTSGRLGFTLFTYTVADVGYRQFLLHDPSGARHSFDRFGNEIPHQRIPGASGAPVFRLRNGTDAMNLSLAGFVSRLTSPGLSKSPVESVGVNSEGVYELSDGDIYVTHAQFIDADGIICE